MLRNPSTFQYITVFCLYLISELSIAANPEFSEIERLLRNGENEAAYQSSLNKMGKWESDAEFDFLLGLSALRSNRYPEAQFALERVVHADPGNLYARYALAQTYVELGLKDQAREQLQRISAQHPPQDIARNVNTLLGSVSEDGTRPGTFTAYLEASIGHDDNINRATSDKSVTYNSGDAPYTAPIYNRARKKSDAYNKLIAGGSYYNPLSDTTGVEVLAKATHRNNFSNNRLDENIFYGKGTLYTQLGQHTLGAGAATQLYQLDNSTDQEFTGLHGSWLYQASNGWAYTAGLMYNHVRYPDDKLFDVNQGYAHASIRKRWGRNYHILGTMYGNESAEFSAGDHNASETLVWFYSYYLTISPQHSFHASLYREDGEYDSHDPTFLTTRDDDYIATTVSWNWQFSPQILIKTELGYSDNDSNIDLYSYDRTYAETGLRYIF